jgi:hypothetical protein
VDGDVTFVSASTLTITLAEIPSVGKPVVIETAELVEPSIRFIQRAEGGMVGFSDFIAATEGERADDGGSTKLSDVFAIRRLAIVDGALEYDTGSDEVMLLDELTFDLNSTPDQQKGVYAIDATLDRAPLFDLSVQGDLDVDSAHLDLADLTLNIALHQDTDDVLPPQAQEIVRTYGLRGETSVSVSGEIPFEDYTTAALDGRVSLVDGFAKIGNYRVRVQSLDIDGTFRDGRWVLDPFVLNAFDGVVEGRIEVSPRPERVASLSADLRSLRIEQGLASQLADEHAVTGDLSGTVSASLPLSDANAAQVDLDLQLRDGSATFDDYRLQVEAADVTAVRSTGQWTVDPIDVKALGGRMTGAMTIDPSERWRSKLEANVDGMHLEQALDPSGEGEPPEYAGRVTLNGTFLGEPARLTGPDGTLEGQGSLLIEEGRLIDDPVLGPLMRAIDPNAEKHTGNDRASASFEIGPRQVRARDIEVSSRWMAARGEGEVNFDSRIDFRFNGGPLEKAQNLLGAVGDLLGQMTDKLLKYHITGTVDDVKVTVRPFGIGADTALAEEE